MSRVLSVILLPTLECNVACDYCFEEKAKIQLSLEQLPTLAERLLDHLAPHHSREAHLYWQGGEVMLLGAAWFEQACDLLNQMAEARDCTFHHHLQTNLIGWNRSWHDVVHRFFGGSLGTSMDYPNVHRRLLNGSCEQYTRLWLKAVQQAQDDGIQVGVIAVLHPATLATAPEEFYRFFTETAGIRDFQVNMPFPGGPNDQVETLDCEPLVEFLTGLLRAWNDSGREEGIKLGPFSELVDHFSGRPAQLPCIWQQNCANEFLAVDARGQTALCDCWVTSYKGHAFGNLFLKKSLPEMLTNSPARKRFLERPQRLIESESRDFWSVIVYSKKTKAFVYNDLGRVGLSSYDKSKMKMNDDGSVDIYFGKTAPKGLSSNWIPTAGEDFFLLFRFYGPEEAFFNRTFKLPDLEKLDEGI